MRKRMRGGKLAVDVGWDGTAGYYYIIISMYYYQWWLHVCYHCMSLNFVWHWMVETPSKAITIT